MIRALWNWLFPPAPRYPTMVWLRKELGTDGYYYFRPVFMGVTLVVNISKADFANLLDEMDSAKMFMFEVNGGVMFDGVCVKSNASLGRGVCLK